jgi:FkbM family methyltransferase
MRARITNLIKKALGIHHQSGVKPLRDMRSLGWRRHSYHVPEQLLDPTSVCYCVGAGEDVSFDTELKIFYDCDVYIFDPTPYGINHFTQLKQHIERGQPFAASPKNSPYPYRISAEQLAQITYVPVGVWSSKTVLKFHDPQIEDYASYSVCLFKDSEAVIEAPVDRLGSLMKNLGHATIDLLKIEIEGAEYAVVDTIVEDKLDIKAILIEFDEVYHAKDKGYHFRIKRCCSRLRSAGYMLVHSTPNLKRTFVRNDVYAMLKAREAETAQ